MSREVQMKFLYLFLSYFLNVGKLFKVLNINIIVINLTLLYGDYLMSNLYVKCSETGKK